MKITYSDDGSVAQYSFRQSWFGNWLMCNHKGQLDALVDYSPPSYETAVGTAMHAGIEAHLSGQDDDTIAAAIAQAYMDEADKPGYTNTKGATSADAVRLAHRCYQVAARQFFPKIQNIETIEHHFKLQVDERTLTDGQRQQLWISGTWDLDEGMDMPLWDWKGLAVDTPLPTPTGWTTMGEIQVGERLLGGNGQPTTVVAKSKVKRVPCWRVNFRDGSSIVTDDVHQWRVVTPSGPKVLTTPELEALPRPWHIEAPEAIELPDLELPLDPYVLGVWLGDGTSSKGEITADFNDAPHYVDALTERGFTVRQRDNKVGASTLVVKDLLPILREMNLVRNKHIPEPYLRASRSQRLELLRGLMDTDGTCNSERDQCAFDNTNGCLSAGVGELVSLMGWSWSNYEAQPSMPNSKPYRRITFSPTTWNPFLLARKRDAVRPVPAVKSFRRYVSSVERSLTVPTQCVSVDSADHLFLAGEKMVPTHNTSSGQYIPWQVQRWYHQPTFYTLAKAIMLSEIYGPQMLDMSYTFNYGIVIKRTRDEPIDQFIQVTRGRADWAWLITQLWDAVDQRSMQNAPRSDQGWWCSPKWCDHWDGCKGSTRPLPEMIYQNQQPLLEIVQ